MNHKKIERLWREEGLQLPARQKKRKRLYHKDASVTRLRPKYPNHIWAIDFVRDKLSNGRPYKMLTVMDEYTRQALTLHAGTKLGVAEVLEAPYPLIIKRGKPEFIRSDNRPEFVSELFQTWLKRIGIEPIHIYLSRPWENVYNEGFNGTLRNEILNANWFQTIQQAQATINCWIKEYNHIRPHQGLGMKPPVPETMTLKMEQTKGGLTGCLTQSWIVVAQGSNSRERLSTLRPALTRLIICSLNSAGYGLLVLGIINILLL